jgi:hypothetical protein
MRNSDKFTLEFMNVTLDQFVRDITQHIQDYMDVAINLENSLTIPTQLAAAVAILINLVNHSETIIGFFQNNSQILMDTSINTYYREMLELTNQIARITQAINNLSNGVLNLEEFSSSSLSENMLRYQNLLNLSSVLEELFDDVQTIIGQLENLSDDSDFLISENTLNLQGDNLRESGNLLVQAIRSLEERIISENPAFVVQSKF